MAKYNVPSLKNKLTLMEEMQDIYIIIYIYIHIELETDCFSQDIYT